MQCNCGRETNLHKVTRDKKLAGEYERCSACGRILWLWKNDKLSKELKDGFA